MDCFLAASTYGALGASNPTMTVLGVALTELTAARFGRRPTLCASAASRAARLTTAARSLARGVLSLPSLDSLAWPNSTLSRD